MIPSINLDRFMTIFLVLLVLATITEIWLARRHLQHVAAQSQGADSVSAEKFH